MENKNLKIISPVDGNLIGEIKFSEEKEIIEKIEKAEKTFKEWKNISFKERKDYFKKLRKILYEERNKIAELVTREQGKPILEAFIAEILPSIDSINYLLEYGEKILETKKAKHFEPLLSGKSAYYRFKSYGVFAVISPWNYPFSIPFIQIAYVLFTGNTCIFKPSPYTPFTGEKIYEIFKKSGFPDGTLEIIHGGAKEGEILLRDKRIKGVIFTGSVETGKKVMEISSQTPKKVILELGGKDPALVLKDTDPEITAKGIAWGAMMNAGQTCASIEIVYVEKDIYQDFIKKLKEEIEKIRVGNPFQYDTDMGPMTAKFQLEKVINQIEDAKNKGAKILTGGKRLLELGEMYFSPTLITNVNDTMKILKEETFGPLLCALSFENDEEVIEKVNSSIYGLNASIWGYNKKRIENLISKIEAGVITINSHVYSFAEPESSWGGFKESGIGRTHGKFGLLELVQIQYVDYDFNKKPEIFYYPYTKKLMELMDNFSLLLISPSMFVKTKIIFKFLPNIFYLKRHLNFRKVIPSLLKKLL